MRVLATVALVVALAGCCSHAEDIDLIRDEAATLRAVIDQAASGTLDPDTAERGRRAAAAMERHAGALGD